MLPSRAAPRPPPPQVSWSPARRVVRRPAARRTVLGVSDPHGPILPSVRQGDCRTPHDCARGRRSESGWGGKAVGHDVGSTPAPAENALAPRKKKKKKPQRLW